MSVKIYVLCTLGAHAPSKRGQLRDCLVRLNGTKRKSLDQMKNHKRLIEEQEWELLRSTTRPRIASVFNKLRLALMTQEEVMFVELEAAQQKMEDHLLQLKEGCQKVQETLQRAQSHLEEADPLEFLERIQSCLQQCSRVHTVRDPVAEVSCTLSPLLSKGPTEHVIWKRLKSSLSPARARLTLDPATVHCDLVLSEDRTSVWYTQSQRPPRLNDCFGACTVLASEGFTSGEHYWEVHVGSGNWVVGVAEECVTSEQDVHLLPWSDAMVLEMSEFETLQRSGTAETSRFIPPVPRPQKLGVYLDFDSSLVSCYNAEDLSHSLLALPHQVQDRYLLSLLRRWYKGEL